MFHLFLVGALVAMAAGAEAGALFDAARAGDVSTVERLLAGGAPVDEPGPNVETPLIAAALAGKTTVAERLVAHGADVAARNNGGFTPLHAAAYAGSAPIALLLLAKGAPVDDAANKAGATPLLVAAEQDQLELVELLMAHGADATRVERHGYTSLSRALFKEHVRVVRYLKSRGLTCQSAETLGGEVYLRQCLDTGN